MKYLILLLLFLPSLAGAQSAPPPGDTLSRPHYCGMKWYPPSALKRHHEGTTSLKFTITDTGEVENISVENSSGDVELDRAAKFCASNWRYHPARQNGVPIAAPWKADVVWQIPLASPVLELIKDCPPGDTSPPAETSATVTLSFNVKLSDQQKMSLLLNPAAMPNSTELRSHARKLGYLIHPS